MKQVSEERVATTKAIDAALSAWRAAPAHVRVMAGAYVEPLLLALAAINIELQGVQDGTD